MPLVKKMSAVSLKGYRNQVALMNRIVTELLEPTEEEKKYKEKNGEEIEWPKSFMDKQGTFYEWNSYERNLRELKKSLDKVCEYWEKEGEISNEECEKNWSEIEYILDNNFENIQKNVHEKYAVGSGEFEALTNPRVQRMVKLADAVSDFSGLRMALYDHENLKEVSEKANRVKVAKHDYLISKKKFADNYVERKIDKDREQVLNDRLRLEKLQEENTNLSVWVTKTENNVAAVRAQIEIQANELKTLTDKKFIFDSKRAKRLKEMNAMDSYKKRDELQKKIQEETAYVESLKMEINTLSDMKNSYTTARMNAMKDIIAKDEKVAEKYNRMMGYERDVLNEILKDADIQERYPSLAEAATIENGLINTEATTYSNRENLLENHELKLSQMQFQLEDVKEKIKKYNLPEMETMYKFDLRQAKIDLEEMDKDIVNKRLQEDIEQVRTDINNNQNYIIKKEKAITKARGQIVTNDLERDNILENLNKNETNLDRISVTIGQYNKLHSSRKEFANAMKEFDSRKKESVRIIDKAKNIDLTEGTRWMHKNSPEFNRMNEALKAVKECNANDRNDLKNKLKALGEAAKYYKEKKLKDGGWNTGMRNTRLARAQGLINMCELGIQSLSAVPVKAEKTLVEFWDKTEESIKKRELKDAQNKKAVLWKVEEKLENAYKKSDKYGQKIEEEKKSLEEFDEAMMDDEDFSI